MDSALPNLAPLPLRPANFFTALAAPHSMSVGAVPSAIPRPAIHPKDLVSPRADPIHTRQAKPDTAAILSECEG